MPGMTCPVEKYAPIAAMMPSIARRPLSFSAFSLNIVGFQKVLNRDCEKCDPDHRSDQPEGLSHLLATLRMPAMKSPLISPAR